MGDANMNWATRLATLGCEMIYVRHEHCAVAAAMAFARKSGDVGLATVTCGPGVTQLMTALPAAVRASLPMVVFAGEAPLKSGWYNQGIDQAPMVKATGADYHTLHHPERMPVAIRDAFIQARTERRPVVLGIPFDLQNRPWESDKPLPRPSHEMMPKMQPLMPHPEDVGTAAELVDKAERVVVIAGMGAVLSDAASACRALSQKTGGLLATSLPARGLFYDDPYCVGVSGSFSTELGIECLAEADLVIVVGASLAFHLGGGGQLWPKAKMLHIDVVPRSIAQGQETAGHHLRSDARLGVEQLTAAIAERSTPWRSEEIAKRIATEKPDSYHYDLDAGEIDPRDAVEVLDAALPDDWEFVNSSGHCAGFSAHMPKRPQHRFLTIREFGAIGNGTSFAMGVAAARPNDQVVLFDGDGSLLMHIQELETIRRHNLNILIIVINDGAYGSEVHKLRSEGLPLEGSVFGKPDFAGIARGFGSTCRRIQEQARAGSVGRAGVGQSRVENSASGAPAAEEILARDHVRAIACRAGRLFWRCKNGVRLLARRFHFMTQA